MISIGSVITIQKNGTKRMEIILTKKRNFYRKIEKINQKRNIFQSRGPAFALFCRVDTAFASPPVPSRPQSETRNLGTLKITCFSILILFHSKTSSSSTPSALIQALTNHSNRLLLCNLESTVIANSIQYIALQAQP